MPLIKDFVDIAPAVQSSVTALATIVGGVWIYRRFIREVEGYSHIESAAGLTFVGRQGDAWIVELTCTLENKGRAQHKIGNFTFDLNAISKSDRVQTNENWGGQVDFTHSLAVGSFLPKGLKYFFIDPGVTAKYSYVASVPADCSFLNLHCSFSYQDRIDSSHTAETTAKVPAEG